jgi:hypothetical protein
MTKVASKGAFSLPGLAIKHRAREVKLACSASPLRRSLIITSAARFWLLIAASFDPK